MNKTPKKIIRKGKLVKEPLQSDFCCVGAYNFSSEIASIQSSTFSDNWKAGKPSLWSSPTFSPTMLLSSEITRTQNETPGR